MMRNSLANAAVGLGASAWTYCVSAMQNVGEVAQFIGLVFGAGAAVLSFWNAYRTWRKNRKAK